MNEIDPTFQNTTVRLFPLPNVVLFPGAVLPLHIFEQRYKEMTRDALGDNKVIAMALLKPGWEKNYYQRPAIEPVVCIGKILASEKLDDSTYNFLLQGMQRARIVGEREGRPYRLAEVAPITETPVMEIDLQGERQRIHDIFARRGWGQIGVGKQFLEMLNSAVSTAQIADLIAFNFLDDISLKQSLLADGDIRRRVSLTIDAMQRTNPAPVEARGRVDQDPSLN